MDFTFKDRWLKAIALAVATFLIAIASPALPQNITPLDVAPESFPVVLDDKTLFPIQTGVRVGEHSFSPAERAKAISYQIEEIAKDSSIPINAIVVEDQPEFTKIVANQERVLTIWDADAKAAGKSRKLLALEYSQKIKEAIQQYRQKRDLTIGLVGILYTIIATIAFSLLLKFTPIYSVIYSKLDAWREQNLELPWIEVANIAIVLLKIARFAAMCFVLYLYVLLVFHFFPETNPLEVSLTNLLLRIFGNAWNAFVAYLPNALVVFLSLALSYYLLHLLGGIFAAGRQSLSLPGFYSYELNAYTNQPTLMPQIYAQLHENIQDKCNEAGIEILSPHFSAVRDGNQSGMPSDYLPKDYVPPAFRVYPFGNWENAQDGNDPTPPSTDRS